MNEKKDWTIMIYMAGDNNLSTDMAYALQQIREFMKDKKHKINLFVYYDGYSPKIPTMYCDFAATDDNLFYRSFGVQDKLYPPKKRKINENSASMYSIINFVDWCVNKVPTDLNDFNNPEKKGRKAHNYALIFSGHTMGFQSLGLLKDESSDYYMTLKKLNWMLGRLTKKEKDLINEAGNIPIDPNKENLKNWEKWKLKKWESDQKPILEQNLSIIGFDSCVMSMLEVGNQFTEHADRMIASEGSIPNAGWAYATLLGDLVNNPANKLDNIVEKFVTRFINMQNNFSIGGVAVDMAAWDLTKLSNIDQPFESLIDNLTKCFEDKESTIYKQMKRVMLQVHWNCQAYLFEQNVDLSDFCLLLRDEVRSLREELKHEYNDLLNQIEVNSNKIIQEVKNCIILSGFSGGQYQYSNGISLFFPWSFSAYDVSQENYEGLKFINKSVGNKWNKFLQKYLGEITYRPAQEPNDDGSSKTDTKKDIFYSHYYKEQIPNQYETAEQIVGNIAYTVDGNSVKVPESGPTRVPESGPTRVPESGPTRLFGGLNMFFDQFQNFKNVNTPWNISGYSKKTYERQVIEDIFGKIDFDKLDIKLPPSKRQLLLTGSRTPTAITKNPFDSDDVVKEHIKLITRSSAINKEIEDVISKSSNKDVIKKSLNIDTDDEDFKDEIEAILNKHLSNFGNDTYLNNYIIKW